MGLGIGVNSLKPDPEREDIPHATWEGTFRICGIEIQCAVLDNGMRIINAESLQACFDGIKSASLGPFDRDEIERFARWQRGG